MSRTSILLAIGMLAGCEPADDVQVLALPPLERPSPEARLGLPEVEGTWRFVGWEVARGDSTALERTFPSFGDLVIRVQRLDSLAGTFALGGVTAEVVGEARRDGWIALVTRTASEPTGFVTGRYDRDTLWLELTSILPSDEWPRDARAAFVREPRLTEVVWFRGTRPGTGPPTDTIVASSPVSPTDAALAPPPRPTAGQPSRRPPAQAEPSPAIAAPAPPPPPPSPRPSAPAPPAIAPPAPAPEPVRPAPRLLGVPVEPRTR